MCTVYGNEQAVGQGIARAIKDGLVKREDLFVVTKVGKTTCLTYQILC